MSKTKIEVIAVVFVYYYADAFDPRCNSMESSMSWAPVFGP